MENEGDNSNPNISNPNQEIMASRYEGFYDDFQGSISGESDQIAEDVFFSNQHYCLQLQKQQSRINRLLAEVPTVYMVTCIKSENIQDRKRWMTQKEERQQQRKDVDKTNKKPLLDKTFIQKIRNDLKRLQQNHHNHKFILIGDLDGKDLQKIRQNQRAWKTETIFTKKDLVLENQNKQNMPEIKKNHHNCHHFKKIIKGANCLSYKQVKFRRRNRSNQLTERNIRFIMQVLNHHLRNEGRPDDQSQGCKWKTYQFNRASLELLIAKKNDINRCKSVTHGRIPPNNKNFYQRQEKNKRQGHLQTWRQKQIERENQCCMQSQEGCKKRKRDQGFYQNQNEHKNAQQEKKKTKYCFKYGGINKMWNQEQNC